MSAISFTPPKDYSRPHYRTPLDNLNILLLIAANAYSAYLLVEQDLPYSQLLLLYIFQSIIIIVINAFRILLLKEYKTDGFLLNGKPVTQKRSTKIWTALVMLQIFLSFMAAYLFFALFFSIGAGNDTSMQSGNLLASLIGEVNWRWLASSLPLFLLHHIVSFIPEIRALRQLHKKEAPYIGAFAMAPIKRILPMHFIVIFLSLFVAGGNSVALCFIIAVKTISDVVLHRKRVGHA